MSPTGESAGRPGGRGVVLVVEDDEECRWMIRRALVGIGFDVFTASNGRAALDSLVRNELPTPVVMIIDLATPRAGGAELLTVTRGYLRFSSVPVLVTVAVGDQPRPAWAPLEQLRKPFDADALLDAISRLLVAAPP